MSSKILWVNEEYDGPMNGVAEFKGEKLWFVRLNTPSIIPSEMLIPTKDNSDDLFHLYKIDDCSMDVLVKNHEKYCEETGAPLNHGDCRKFRQVAFSKTTTMKRFDHILPENIQAEYVTTIHKSDFVNYHVSRRLD
jgi:hypothetical protein